MTRGRLLGALLLVAVATSVGARVGAAGPLRLRADALTQTQAPVGLLVLGGDVGQPGERFSAEAMIWLGAGDDEVMGDALIIALIARRADGRAEARLGRLITSTGALRPLHLDGLAGRARLPHRIDVDAFAGVPVAPRLGAAAWDWAAGARLGRRLGDWGGVGVAALERRSAGRLEARELGLDGSAALGRLDVSGRAAFDLSDPALADLQLALARRWRAVRAEVRAERRLPSHLLPATSLFTVLGDVASERVGAAVRWRAAPRLDLLADVGARRVAGPIEDDGATEADGVARATLRLDDAGAGAVVGELRRTGAVSGGWTGARLAARLPHGRWRASVEAELVRPDEDRGRGTLWPWAMAALGWAGAGWDGALAIEGGATPSERSRVEVLALLGRRWTP
ncbi:MAG: hypothetical protein KA297_26430 [Kofleriaceae bacterium]|nr:hypothetical protein [Kofleriaceae bacterium]MBP6837816.1 hypothetical protein [Kofleriaceae bacterium]